MLLVDDEPFVLEGLRIMLDWEKWGFSICGKATNGEDALEIIKTCNPHLIITDIKMPVMDGLQLIRSVYEASNLRSRFIILSGYNDFTYAKNAMRYDVSDYILKPLDDEELDKVINKVSRQILEERQMEESKSKLLEFIADSAVHRIIRGEAKESVINRAGFITELKNDEEIKMILFEIDNFDNWMSNFDEISLRKIKDKIRKIVKHSTDSRLDLKIFEDDYDRFFIIASKSMYFYDEIKEYVENLKDIIENDLKCSISVAVSDSMKGIRSLDKLYKQVDLAISYKFFKGNGSIIFYKCIKNTDLNYDFCHMSVDLLFEEIKNNNAAEIRKRIKNVFHFFCKNHTVPEAIKAYIENVEFEIIRYVIDMNGNIDGFSKRLMELNNSIGKEMVDNLKSDFTEFCIFVADYINTISKNNYKDIIKEMKSYIRDNYNKDINLKIIAKDLYVSPVYLGRLFKKSAGIPFNEYLHRVRIEEAKKLLRRTNMKVSDIAKSVGYNDTEYFAGKFKLITQSAPSEFKNMYLKVGFN